MRNVCEGTFLTLPICLAISLAHTHRLHMLRCPFPSRIVVDQVIHDLSHTPGQSALQQSLVSVVLGLSLVCLSQVVTQPLDILMMIRLTLAKFLGYLLEVICEMWSTWYPLPGSEWRPGHDSIVSLRWVTSSLL